MYATQQDIIDRYGTDELITVADRDNNDIVNVDDVTTALQDASDEIDTYIGSRYNLPLATTPPALTRVCVDIALYRLSTESALTEEKRQRYQDAVKLLTAIAKGEIKLDPPGPGNNSPVSVEITGPGRRFNRQTIGRIL